MTATRVRAMDAQAKAERRDKPPNSFADWLGALIDLLPALWLTSIIGWARPFA